MVSVIMPVYNAADTLAETIESVLSQQEVEFELIVVDDGSTDNSKEIVLKYASEYPCLRIFSQENQGTAVARNKAIEKANGELIAPIDADDLWSPLKLSLIHI